MKLGFFPVAAAVLCAAGALAQQQASVVIDENTITVKNATARNASLAAAAFHTEADLAFQGMFVPKGDYTMFVIANGNRWELALNKATGPRAAIYDPKMDLGRAPMTLSKTPSPSPGATCTVKLTKTAALAAKVEVAWNNTVASVPFHLDRTANDSEW